MANSTLADLFNLGEETAVKDLNLPIDETAPDFDKNWMRTIV